MTRRYPCRFCRDTGFFKERPCRHCELGASMPSDADLERQEQAFGPGLADTIPEIKSCSIPTPKTGTGK